MRTEQEIKEKLKDKKFMAKLNSICGNKIKLLVNESFIVALEWVLEEIE